MVIWEILFQAVRESPKKKKITDFSYIGHGWKKALYTGYNAIEEGADFDALYTKKLQTSAFSVNCNVYLNAMWKWFWCYGWLR